MSKFDNREEDEDWKARDVLKRFGKAELERSGKEWAKKEPAAGRKKAGADCCSRLLR
jgi:hypothetical protein